MTKKEKSSRQRMKNRRWDGQASSFSNSTEKKIKGCGQERK